MIAFRRNLPFRRVSPFIAKFLYQLRQSSRQLTYPHFSGCHEYRSAQKWAPIKHSIRFIKSLQSADNTDLESFLRDIFGLFVASQLCNQEPLLLGTISLRVFFCAIAPSKRQGFRSKRDRLHIVISRGILMDTEIPSFKVGYRPVSTDIQSTPCQATLICPIAVLSLCRRTSSQSLK